MEVVVLNHATALTEVDESQVLAWSSASSFLDFNESESRSLGEPMGPFPVAAKFKFGKGKVALVSDPSIMINSMVRRDDNLSFIKFLVYNGEEILIDRAHLGKSPLDESKIRLASVRGFFFRTLSIIGTGGADIRGSVPIYASERGLVFIFIIVALVVALVMTLIIML